MSARVELINNSYTQRMKILINGDGVSEYSGLKRYMDEPFYYWCDKILDAIYEECGRSEFIMHFASRTEETRIMDVITEKYDKCIQYSSTPTMIADSLTQRLSDLNVRKCLKILHANRKALKILCWHLTS